MIRAQMNRRYRSVPVRSAEITAESLYRTRRDFLRAAGILGGGALLAACAPSAVPAPAEEPASASGFQGQTDELGAPLNSYGDITKYNNYCEFSTTKEAVAPLSAGFKSDPWSVEVTGLVGKPRTFAMEDLFKMFPQEDRI